MKIFPLSTKTKSISKQCDHKANIKRNSDIWGPLSRGVCGAEPPTKKLQIIQMAMHWLKEVEIEGKPTTILSKK